MSRSDRPASPLDEYLTREEWAEACGRSVRSLKRDALLRRGPRPIFVGRTCYYKKKSISDWLRSLEEAAE